MADRVLPGPLDASAHFKEAVCVNVRKIFDSCKDKDCVEDLHLYPTQASQAYIDSACSVRPRSAELLGVDIDVEEVGFNRGYYTVDCKYFYKIKGVTFPGGHEITGLCLFDKRVMLFGSDATAKVFWSDGCTCPMGAASALPTAVCETVDPIILSMKLFDAACKDHGCGCGGDPREVQTCVDTFVPSCIRDAFDDDIFLDAAQHQVYVTLGQFSIIRLERETQLVMPVYDYCMPDKECAGGAENDPCALFANIPFPVDEFFPPDQVSMPGDYRSALNNLG